MSRRLALLVGSVALLAAAHGARGDDKKDSPLKDQLAKVFDRWNDDDADRIAKGIEVCQARIKEASDDADAHLELARLLLAKSDYAGASAESDKAATGNDVARTRAAKAVGLCATFGDIDERAKKETEGKSDDEKKAIKAKLMDEARVAQRIFLDACGAPDVARAAFETEKQNRDNVNALAELGKPPRAIAVKDTDGKDIDLASYKGKVVLIDFWATWCGPCVGELPNVLKTYKTYHEKGFEIVGISLDNERAKLDDFLKAKDGMTWRQYFDGKGWNNEVAKAWNVRSIPKTYLLDHTGKVRYVGARGDALAPAVKELLERAEKAASK